MAEETSGAQQEKTEKHSGMSFSRVVVFMVVVAVIIVGGYFVMNQTSGAVAVVNGQKISRAEYDERYAQLATSLTSQGQSATSTQMQAAIKTQTLDNLIAETLLLQAASKEGIKADDQAVSARLTQNKAQFADNAAFEKALTAQGYTDATYKTFLTRSDIIQRYLLAHIALNSVKATDAEVNALYNQAAANNKTIPPLAQVRTQVENQIVQLKQQQLITNFVQQLKASSTVETLLK